MKPLRVFSPPALALAALLCLAPAIGRAPSLVPGAAAYSVNSWDIEEGPEENAVARLLRDHGRTIFTGVAVALFVVFGLMIGPVGRVPRGRFGGFGGGGGFNSFGGSTSLRNPWE